MKRKTIGFAFALLLGLISGLSSCSVKEVTANYNVIPIPNEITAETGNDFILDSKTVIVCNDTSLQNEASFLQQYLVEMTGHKLAIKEGEVSSNAIVLSLGNDSENPEGYKLTVNDQNITISGSTASGVFYGIQTLRKSIPVGEDKQNVKFPAVIVNDGPRFAYRGAMLDTSRHMFTIDSIKSFIDMLALHNLNRFHWHLSEDQGWRIEIKSRPELTKKGSMRKGTCIGKDFDSLDSIPYGGFYTQEEAREIVKYAAERHITVIPEIDMPGHMLGALAAYPELGCTGGPYEVWTRWGVSDDVLCAGNDSVLTFIDDVLGEIVDIFPSEYIHVGGDECPKLRWKECPKCQAKAKALGLKANEHGTVEEQLQSYLIHHASDFLTSKGRKMIGWDETLEGGLAPGAVVMSWRGEDGGKAAARQGHDVIMTPNTYLYFDYYQSADRENEPLAIGGYLPIEKVYSFNPTPEDLTAEENKHIYGVQANLWTEYIPNYGQVEYMMLPRLAALSEIQWSEPTKRNFDEFLQRLMPMIRLYEKLGYNYSPRIFDIKGELTAVPEKREMKVSFTTLEDTPIYYTLDGTEPTEKSILYTEPFALNESAVIKAVAPKAIFPTKMFVDSISFNKATCSNITLNTEPSPRFPAHGAATLVDGKLGGDLFNDGNWLGYYGNDMDATLDLGTETELSSATLRNFIDQGDWIYDSPLIEVFLSSDGQNYEKVASETNTDHKVAPHTIKAHKLSFPTQKARYVRIKAKTLNSIPAWHEAAKGKPAHLFVDEIILE